MRPEVSRVSDIMGFDPLFLANEGKFMVVAADGISEEMLREMRKDDAAQDGRIIGVVKDGIEGVLLCRCRGGTRVLRPPYGEMLPRVC